MIRMKKPRKIPLRKCIVSGEQLEKEQLIRVVKNKQDEVFVDDTGKAHGRGAYLKKDKAVIAKAAKRNLIAKHFGVSVDPGLYETLQDLLDG